MIIEGAKQRGVAKYQFDFSKLGGAIGNIALNGDKLPAKAVVYGGVCDVITSPDSATHAATIAITIEGANDIITAAQVNGAPWSSIGIKAITPVSTAGTSVKTTVARQPTAVVAAEALNAGKFNLFLLYFISD